MYIKSKTLTKWFKLAKLALNLDVSHRWNGSIPQGLAGCLAALCPSWIKSFVLIQKKKKTKWFNKRGDDTVYLYLGMQTLAVILVMLVHLINDTAGNKGLSKASEKKVSRPNAWVCIDDGTCWNLTWLGKS